MKNFIELLDKLLSPKTVLIMFAFTACYGLLVGIVDLAVFGGALGTVLGYFYGSKQGEVAANLANAQINAMEKGSVVPVPPVE